MTKKGIFFTLLAIILSGLFIASFSFYVAYQQSRQMDAIEVRVITMNELIKSVENDLERALYISSFRALLSLSDRISITGSFLNDTQDDFQSMVLEGTITNETEPLMVNQTLVNWSNKIEVLAQQIDVNLHIRIINVTIAHTSPWEMEVRAAVNMSVDDKKETASWQRTSVLSTSIGIDGFEDPVYLIGSNGKIVRIIAPTNTTAWNISALQEHFGANTFVANPDAPNFLQRLEGKLNASINGIETLVDTEELYVYGEDVLNRSSVDYIYFGSRSTKNYKIRNITDDGNPYFQLDEEHLNFYNVLGHNYTE